MDKAAIPGGILRPPASLQEPTPAREAIKRALDLAIVTLLLPVALIVMVPVALAIWLHDGGPVIYRHRRVGRGGLAFDCLKFRTMRRDADRALDAHLARSPEARAEWAASRKLRHDPRVLGRLGRFLRETSLDELPQLFNVLGGAMSLVGPRPVVREELARYAGQRHWYLAVRPGVTGPWQVGGRSDTSYAVRVRLDVDYARNPSLRRDLGILLRTMRLLLSRKGAC
jgi:exopolysaccharide production protein ExoY